jgi:hypothetical protein
MIVLEDRNELTARAQNEPLLIPIGIFPRRLW